MTNQVNHVPEPKQQKKDDVTHPPQNAQLPISSSEDDSGSEEEFAVGESLNGYQPLTLYENDGGSAEFRAEPLNFSDEMVEGACSESPPEETRELAVDADLVLNAMKGVSLPGSNVPPWAKELSDSEWNNIIKRTISGEKPASTDKTENDSGADIPLDKQ